MDPVTNIIMLACAICTASALFASNTRGLIWILFIQAVLLGIDEIASAISHLNSEPPFDVVVEFIVVTFEFSLGAVAAPAIINHGINKTANVQDKPVLNARKWLIPVLSVVAVLSLACGSLASQLPEQIDTIPHVILILSIAILSTLTRRDALKIIAGINMAENALIPLTVSGAAVITPFVLGMIIFIDLMFVFITIEAYRDHGVLDIQAWRRDS